MDKTLIICLLIWFAAVVVLGLAFGDTVLERIRRKKHPVWYTHWNRALSNSFAIGSRFREMVDTLDNRRDMLQGMFFRGECTADEYNKVSKAIDKDFEEAYKWFEFNKTALGIDEDLKAADAYAKEHNLKWGIIYSDE